jgi:hypothetical protein
MQAFRSMKTSVEPLLAMLVVAAGLAACVGLAMAVIVSNADIVGMTDAIGACALVLADDADTEPLLQCVATVGNQHPTSQVLQSCASLMAPHSQTGGRTAGLMLGECLRRGV